MLFFNPHPHPVPPWPRVCKGNPQTEQATGHAVSPSYSQESIIFLTHFESYSAFCTRDLSLSLVSPTLCYYQGSLGQGQNRKVISIDTDHTACREFILLQHKWRRSQKQQHKTVFRIKRVKCLKYKY